jgi:hypothetical protein
VACRERRDLVAPAGEKYVVANKERISMQVVEGCEGGVDLTEQTLFGPTLPIYEAYNPAIAEVDAEHVFSVAEFDVLKNGMAPEAAIDKAFKRADEIFTRYPIAQS